MTPALPDADAEFREFMAARWPSLVRTAYLLTGSHHSAEDLAQTAMVRAFVKWPRVRASNDPAAYVRQIMVHCHADQFRRRRVAEWLTARLPEPQSPPPSAVDGDETEVLFAALARIPARQRTVVVLYYFDDMTHAQIAAALGSRESTVRGQLSRALARLRKDGLLAELDPRAAMATAPGESTASREFAPTAGKEAP